MPSPTYSSGSCRSSDQHSSCFSINGLPDSILRFIGEYVVPSSRAIMASALSRQACFDSDTLDFSDIGRELSFKLTDSDISDILVSIDAVIRLKVLKLIGCENISGVGLYPLRGSTTIQQIDLTTTSSATLATCGDIFSPNFPWSFALSEDAVIPILDSIIAEKDRSLRHMQFPLVWRKKKSAQIIAFMERYGHAQSSRTCLCAKCSEVFQASSSWMNQTKDSLEWGLQHHTCYECASHICQECEEEFCEDCRKQFCEDCCTTKRCESCSALVCANCEDLEVCDGCGNCYCSDCMPVRFCECCDRTRCMDCIPHWDCSQCWRSNCDECAHEHNVQWCEVCEDEHCNDCRLKDYINGDLDCKGCRGLLLPRIMHGKEVLSSENEMLKFVVINALKEISQDPSKVVYIGSPDEGL